MQLLQNGKQQFIDQNGAPLANGSVYFYAPGTTNPLPTYQDQGGTIANTNPIQLDSRGQAIIWGSATYRQIVKDCNAVTIWDQIVTCSVTASDLSASSGASLVGWDGGTLASFLTNKINRVVDSIASLRSVSKAVYTHAFVTGYYAARDGGGGAYVYDATDTTSLDNGGTIIVASDGGRWKLVYTAAVTVKQFGAKGDGTTDDTVAINNACSALSTTGGKVVFPPSSGRYVVNGVVVNVANVAWEGTDSPSGGLLVKQAIYIKQPGFSASRLDCLFGGTFTTSETCNCFSVYNADTTVVMADFSFNKCTFTNFFFAIHFFGCLDSLPNGDAAHTTNPIFNTSIVNCKATAQPSQNAGHFQHQFTRNSLVQGCQTFNGQNCSSYNFYRDCRDIRVIGNYDANSAWGAVEIENCPLANAEISGNTFASNVSTQTAAIWVDDSANVRVFGNNCQWDLAASCGNAASPGGNYAGEICTQTTAFFENNTARFIRFNQYSTYVSGSVVADAKDNVVFGNGTQGIFCDAYYYGGSITGNSIQGGSTYSIQLARTNNLNVTVRANKCFGSPAIVTGSGGTIIAYDNDVYFSDQTETNLQGLNITEGYIKVAPVSQVSIGASGNAPFVFNSWQAVTTFSVSNFSFKALCRDAGANVCDYVTFDVLVTNTSGTPTCAVSPLTKRLANTASNFTVTAGMVGNQITITLTNAGASALLVTMYCEGLMRL